MVFVFRVLWLLWSVVDVVPWLDVLEVLLWSGVLGVDVLGVFCVPVVPLWDVSCATPSVAASSAAERIATALVMYASEKCSPSNSSPRPCWAGIRYTP